MIAVIAEAPGPIAFNKDNADPIEPEDNPLIMLIICPADPPNKLPPPIDGKTLAMFIAAPTICIALNASLDGLCLLFPCESICNCVVPYEFVISYEV